MKPPMKMSMNPLKNRARWTVRFAATASLLALAAGGTGAAAETSTALQTVNQIVDRHIEAKGGRASWDRIESVRITGDFTAFSKVKPFVLHRKRDRLYHLDHTMNGRRVIVGHDGASSWWDNGFSPAGPVPMTQPADLAALERELDFQTPLFNYQERGFELTLLADDNIEGIPAIALQLERSDGSLEVWYLDPDSYLELARKSPGSDFGRPLLSRTFFDDFREVGGVQLPFHVETQWYTRDRIMNIAEIELNPKIDDSLFGMPGATGMELLQKMVGEWSVQAKSKQSPFQPEFTESQRQSVVTASLNGGLVEERYAVDGGTENVRTFSYDRFREHYVMTQMDSGQTYLDIQTGALEDGRLTLSNVSTETSFSAFGRTIHERSTVSNLTDDGFTLERENSQDGGDSWQLMEELTYTHAAADSSGDE